MNDAKSLNSHKLGLIYEFYGLKKDAKNIYTSILKDTPEDKLALDEIHRLETKNTFPKANKKQKERFINIKSQDDINEFKRWLKQWN